MTAPLPDGELRAMLEARADRVSPDTSRSAMAGFRAAVHGSSDGRGGFSVVPQALSARGARLPWGVAVVGLVAVVIVAIVGAQTQTTDRNRSTPAVVATPGAADVAGSPAASAPAVIDARSFERLLASGALRGQVVVIVGRLVTAACPSGVSAADCPTAIAGWPGVRVVVPEDPATMAASASAFGLEGDAPLAFRAGGDGRVTFLGIVDAGTPVPLSGTGLARLGGMDGQLVLARGELLELRGAEVFMACPSPVTGAASGDCLLRTTFLLRDEASGPGGVAGAGVDLSPEVDASALPSDRAATFLVRRVDDRWQVEGQQTVSTVSVETPADEVAEISPQGLRAALADGSIDGRLIVMDGVMRLVQVPCPQPGACAVPILRGLDDVRIAVDPAIATLLDAPPREPLVFLADGTGLRYLGTSSDALEARDSVTGLIALGDPTRGDDLRLVDGWLLEGCVLAETKNESLHEADADRRLPVAIADGVTRANVVPGPFLVRPTLPPRVGSPAWQVIAQVPHQPVIRVSSP
jgi:hypothetical protein